MILGMTIVLMTMTLRIVSSRMTLRIGCQAFPLISSPWKIDFVAFPYPFVAHGNSGSRDESSLERRCFSVFRDFPTSMSWASSLDPYDLGSWISIGFDRLDVRDRFRGFSTICSDHPFCPYPYFALLVQVLQPPPPLGPPFACLAMVVWKIHA
jgi:hypothetical protein